MLGTLPVPVVDQATTPGAAGHEQQPQAPAANFSKSYPFPTGTVRTGTLLYRDGILKRHYLSRFLGINSSLLRLKSLSGFLPSFFLSTKCYSGIDSSFLVSRICMFF
jgi:hypothetical protein